ncbi:glycoside hydrolase family 3 C-terminal domain-containing protein [Glaciihabitans sp. dw_435]|uniref:glycoside hydrolase family 3 C-terminal domain-containing protein n=1 Tax=Glaciihabitans sp. dw_435 TaxID=2720081 RepID=UPI001BD2E28C|nr:glycoside hydrolase family 3 C-terminal domain-containing protein [Glaciihabitans sp. dw_435]
MHENPQRGKHVVFRSAVALGVSVALAVSGVAAAQAATTNPNPGALELENGQLSRTAATQGMVLLENHGSVLPLAKTGNVAVFGVGSYQTVKGGTGSGAVNNRYAINVRQGLTNAGYSITTSPAYYDAMKAAYDTKYPPTTGGSGFGPTVDYASVEQALTSTTAQPTQPTDTAVFVIARNSGEGADRSSGKGDYLLTDIEKGDLQTLGQTYKKVVVVLNVGGVVDTAFFDQINGAVTDPAGGQALDSMLLMSQAGQESGNAVTDVLNGSVTPSGKLTDTWASSYNYYPASASFATNDGSALEEQYSEGIYVGYRYFDSLYKKLNPADPASVVDYPFGYGLSYTDFKLDTQSVTADMTSVTAKVKVTNVGTTYSGKDVVEAYFSAPQTGLDKPYQELAGYAKTDELAPGASQTVTIRYNTADMASYDQSKAAYTLEAGDYRIRIGESSRNTHVESVLHLAATTITEQLANEENDTTVDTELTSDPADFYAYDTESAEIAAAPVVTLNTAGYTPANNASEFEQNVSVDSTSPYYALDKDKIGSTTAYVPATGADNWENTGAPYAAKTGETLKTVTTDPTKTLFDVAKGTTTLQQFVAGLNVTQLANIVEGASAAGTTLTAVGAAGYTTAKYESLGLPGMTLSDGPAGLRITQKIATTPATYQFGTAWPIGTLLAQTWDPSLVKQVATAVGKEMAEYGVSLWLAPGMNIHRDPLNGRNFEYYSEDPLIAGLTAAATTAGVQSVPGEGVTIKHFFANNQETLRTTTNAVISERAEREIYLKGFEIAVKSAQPMAIMTSYNKVNDTYTSGSYDLNTDILRGEWGFKGLVMTDWGAGPRTGATGVYYSGNDLIEPGNNTAEVINAIRKVVPAIDSSGLPVYNKLTTLSNNRTSYTWSFNGLIPSATGAETISTPVTASTVTAAPKSGATIRDTINNETFTPNAPYATVADAFADVQSLLAGTALNATQKPAITVTDVVHQTSDPGSPVVSYTVNVRGDYSATGYNLRLGDLQRSAMNIMNVATQTAGFGQLATNQGVSGITVRPYTGQFTNLTSYLDVTKGKVIRNQTGNGPTVTISASAPVPASGWYKAPVTITVTSNDGDAQSYIDVDTGVLTNYTAPVTISTDGEHKVRALAVNDDGAFSAIASLKVKIDSMAPVATVVSAANGKLSLAATDAGSGVASIEYSVDGFTWATYTDPVTIPGTPRLVSYRATDVAGNVSAANTVAVAAGTPTATAPVITTQPKAATVVNAGSKVTLSAAAKGTPKPTVQWQVSANGGKTWLNLSKATSTTFTMTANSKLSGYLYHAVFTNSAGTTVSSSAKVTVKALTNVSIALTKPKVKTTQHEVVRVVVAPTLSRPTGTVTVHYGSKTATIALTSAKKGYVSVTLPTLKKGTYKVYATYNGSATFAPDSSRTVTLTVVK